MEYIFWVVGIILFLAVGYFCVGTYAAFSLTSVGDHPQYNDDPETFGLDFEKNFFPSRQDHLRIAAWFIPNSDAERVVILVHGRNASKQNAISGHLPELAYQFHQAHLAVLMIDLRGHGESEGKQYTYGIREQFDVLGAVDFLLERGYSPGKIGVLGISLGGAAAIRAAAKEQAIGALAVDSTFADLMQLVAPHWKDESGLPLFFLPGVFIMVKLLFGLDLKDAQPVDLLKTIPPRPILIIHSDSDEMVDVKQAHLLKEAVPQARLVVLGGCSHAELFRDLPKEYLAAVLPFFQGPWK